MEMNNINLQKAVSDYLEEKHADDKFSNNTEDTGYNKDNNTYRPIADYHECNGDDGRGPTKYIITYSCPKCFQKINENDIACAKCRIFFDWSKKAKVKVFEKLVWE